MTNNESILEKITNKTPKKIELGDVMDKYIKLYGAADTIMVYNSFALKAIEREKNYEYEEFIRKADRYMSFCFYLKNKK